MLYIKPGFLKKLDKLLITSSEFRDQDEVLGLHHLKTRLCRSEVSQNCLEYEMPHEVLRKTSGQIKCDINISPRKGPLQCP